MFPFTWVFLGIVALCFFLVWAACEIGYYIGKKERK